MGAHNHRLPVTELHGGSTTISAQPVDFARVQAYDDGGDRGRRQSAGRSDHLDEL